MTISKRARFEVLRRDGHRCRYCGGSVESGAVLTVDHVVPVALGGGDDPSNLVAACRDCNAGKTSTSPDDQLVADVAEDAVRWAQARAVATQALEAEQADRDAYAQAFVDAWSSWDEKLHLLPADFLSQVTRWHEAGVPANVLRESVDIAMSAKIAGYKVFRYLCGVVKRRIERLDQHQNAALTSPQEG